MTIRQTWACTRIANKVNSSRKMRCLTATSLCLHYTREDKEGRREGGSINYPLALEQSERGRGPCRKGNIIKKGRKIKIDSLRLVPSLVPRQSHHSYPLPLIASLSSHRSTLFPTPSMPTCWQYPSQSEGTDTTSHTGHADHCQCDRVSVMRALNNAY